MANSHLGLTSQGLLGDLQQVSAQVSLLSTPIFKGNVAITVPEREAASRAVRGARVTTR